MPTEIPRRLGKRFRLNRAEMIAFVIAFLVLYMIAIWQTH